MPLSPPPAVNYPSPLIAYPSFNLQSPSDGPKSIPCEVDWGTMGGDNNCVNFNFANNTTLAWSYIRSLLVDNSECGSDIQFYFPDTQTTLSIPAFTPYALVPVFTGQKQFLLLAPNAETEDITRFQILNYSPPPVVVPTSQEQDFASVASISTATPATQIIPANVSGTLENAYVYVSMDAANSGTGTWELEDGNGLVIGQGNFQVSAGDKYNIVLFQLSELRVRFQNGISLNLTESAVLGGLLSVSLFYRTP